MKTREPATQSTGAELGAGPRELCLVAALALLVQLVWLVTTSAWSAFSRTPWIDECVTLLLAGDPSLRHAAAALFAGIDSNPPTLHLIVRAVAAFFDGPTPVLLRSVAFASLWLAMIALYGVLRRSYSPFSSGVAVLVFAGHPLVIHHGFDGRYYAPWITFVTWFCLALPRPDQIHLSRGRRVALAIASSLLCTIHYFGIVTLGIVLAADFLVNRAPIVDWLRSRAAVIAGPLSLLLFLPLFLSQQAASPASTWVPPLDLQHAGFEFGRLILPLLRALGVVLAGVALNWVIVASWPERPRFDAIRAQLPVAALAAMPLALAVFSWIVQPVFMARYAIAFVPAAAPLAAFLLARLKPLPLGVVASLLLLLGGISMKADVERLREMEADRQHLWGILEALPPEAPVYFERIHDLYPLCHVRGSCPDGYALFDDATEPGHWLANLSVISREMGRMLETHYGGPPVRAYGQLEDQRGLFFVRTHRDLETLEKQFPDFRASASAGQVVRLERRSTP